MKYSIYPYLLFILMLSIVSCKSKTASKTVVKTEKKATEKTASEQEKTEEVVTEKSETKEVKKEVTKEKEAENKENLRLISGVDVVKIAEKFIGNQGYTKKKVDLELQKITFEQGEFATDTNAILQLRQNTLYPNSIGIRQYGKNSSWIAGFELVAGEDNIARAVVMDKYGQNVKMSTKDVRIDWLQGKIIPAKAATNSEE